MAVLKEPKDGDRLDSLDSFYPTELIVVGRTGHEEMERTVTSYGYMIQGAANVHAAGLSARLEAGGFFCLPGRFSLTVDGLFAVIRRLGYIGQTVIGRIEDRGRLSYIDGCSDSQLVYPPRMGDPCLNYLHFPPGVHQTQHTHPSIRMGIVARGRGKAFREPAKGNSGWEQDLTQGCVFLLPEQEQHSFRTTETDCEMDVIAYHPDSDIGPTDAAHPMRSRTYIGNDRNGRPTGG
jgi:quercetin dioxygenase-like cupin family protein